jgi:polyribonucleotide 5'-hydroxyl-kinase
MEGSVVSQTYALQPETELRCEVQENGSLRVVLLEGSAELYGIELALNREYTFSDENVAIFTWYGCRLQTYAEHVSAYISDSTPMVAYANTHIQLEAMRDAALANHDYGPRVLVAGPSDSGKSTTARTLAAYACRLDRTPLFLDLDVGQNAVTLPGTLCATPLNKFSLSVEEGFLHTTPLVYSLGHNTPRDHGEVYNKMTSILAEKVDERMKRDLDLRSSGMIVNTSGHIDDDGYEALLHCIKELNIDVVLVMGHDRLYSSLSSSLQDSVAIVKLPQSGGVVRRERQHRTRARQARIQEYFYGKNALRGQNDVSFSPARIDLQISSLMLMKAGGLQISEHMRVMGDKGTGSTELVRVHPTEQELDRSILAVLFSDDREAASANDEVNQALLRSNVAGFVYVVNCDIEQDTMTVLAPNAGPLPSNYLLMGSIKWDEK